MELKIGSYPSPQLEATAVKWGDSPMRLASLYWRTRLARGLPLWVQ
ncbi:MAG: hypothetical protein RMY33_006415 [Nostoc sp. DedQUE03]